MIKRKYTNFILIISILVALLAISSFIFFLKVVENKNKHASGVMVTLSNKMADKEDAELLTKKFTELESTYQNINNYFIDSSKIDTFVDYLEKLGTENKTELTIKNVEVSPKEQNAINFRVLVSGEFSNVMKVIYLLENIPYHITLTQVFINKETKTVEEDIKGIKKEKVFSYWWADASFSILSLPK